MKKLLLGLTLLGSMSSFANPSPMDEAINAPLEIATFDHFQLEYEGKPLVVAKEQTKDEAEALACEKLGYTKVENSRYENHLDCYEGRCYSLLKIKENIEPSNTIARAKRNPLEFMGALGFGQTRWNSGTIKAGGASWLTELTCSRVSM
ncbi:MAG: hypothetical protein KC478_01185 [Bacteriovoracaceae bacterium]|nr:hypothetical protein [Bacteriovoracaceae bacterium]